MKSCTAYGPKTQILENYDLIKVFSATKAGQRQTLGDVATHWLNSNSNYLEPTGYTVTQSSDHSFHCLTIVIFCKYL